MVIQNDSQFIRLTYTSMKLSAGTQQDVQKTADERYFSGGTNSVSTQQILQIAYH